MSSMLGENLNGEWENGDAALVEPALVYEDEHHHGNTLTKLNTLRKGQSQCSLCGGIKYF